MTVEQLILSFPVKVAKPPMTNAQRHAMQAAKEAEVVATLDMSGIMATLHAMNESRIKPEDLPF